MNEIDKIIGEFNSLKRKRKVKYLDWEKARKLCLEHPNSDIWAGIIEDMGNTGDVIYDHGEWCNGHVYDRSFWGTPSLEIFDDEVNESLVIPCWTYEEHENTRVPDWWLTRREA